MFKKRNSNLEILRIISMILIIFHHYAMYGFDVVGSSDITFNKCLIDVLILGGKIGVALFIFISGYFMIDSKFTLKKLWKLVGEVTFYSVGILILFLTVLKPVGHIGVKNILKCLLPLIYSHYWFMTCYIILMILSPFLNKFAKCLSRKEFEKLLIIVIVIWSFIATIFSISMNSDMYCNNMIWTIVMYLIGCYIKLHVKIDKKLVKTNRIILIVSSLLLFLSSIVINLLGKYTHYNVFFNNTRMFFRINSFLVLFVSIGIFIAFLNRKSFTSKFINEVSLCTLGVYLIHEHIVFKPYLWHNILKTQNFYESNYLVLHSLISVFIVFVGCSAIDYIRIKLIEPLWMKGFDYIDKKFKVGKLYD